MLSDLSDIGRRVSVQLSDDSKIEGWLYGDIPQGTLIAEDAEGSRIRLVQWQHMSYPKDAPRANFAPANLKETKEQINSLDEKIRPRMEIALKKLDLRPLQRFFYRAPELRRAIQEQYQQVAHLATPDFENNPSNELFYLTAARADEAVELHSEVFNELEQSGIADIVSEHAQELASLPAKYTLPSVDAALDDVSRLGSEAEAVREGTWSIQQHRSDLDVARHAREQAVFQAIFRRSQPAAAPRRPWPRGTLTRYFGAGLQILGGTVLAAANPLFGIPAGLTSTILTIGATAIPVSVGVTTSVGTGLTAAGNGLGLIGVIRKDCAATP